MFFKHSLLPSNLQYRTDIDKIFENLFSDKSEGYPVSDIYVQGDKTYIELAVTGFSPEELEIFVEDKTLVIKGEKSQSEENTKDYIIRKIAKRNFVKKYSLLQCIDNFNAELKNGILKIELIKCLDSETKLKIDIKS